MGTQEFFSGYVFHSKNTEENDIAQLNIGYCGPSWEDECVISYAVAKHK